MNANLRIVKISIVIKRNAIILFICLIQFNFLIHFDFVFQMTTETEQAREQLQKWLNKTLRISIVDGRVLVGMFLCTDRDQNIILGNCNEYIGSPSEQEEFRVLGLALIPGQHIQSIYIDENSTLIPNSSASVLDDDKSDG